MFYDLLSLTPQYQFYQPEGIGGHTILDINATHIVKITKSAIIKVDANLIIRNWEQRQIERFRNMEPGVTVTKAVTQLATLNENYLVRPDSLKFMIMSKEINTSVNVIELTLLRYLDHLEKKIQVVLPHTNIAAFEEIFSGVYERKVLEHHIEELKFKNSSKNLSLYPDYCNKLEVLRSLNYIDEIDEGKISLTINNLYFIY